MLAGYKTYIVSAVFILEGIIAVTNGLMADPVTLSMADFNTILGGLGLSALRAGVSK